MSAHRLRVELVVVGDELLEGRVVDANSNFLCRELAELGLTVRRILTVGDNEGDIQAALRQAFREAKLVIVVGGMGPTPDDRTLRATTQFLGQELVVHKPTLRRIEQAFRRTGRRVPARALDQALAPEASLVLENRVGMVPGMVLTWGGCTLVMLPGVPRELEDLFARLRPLLSMRFRPKSAATLRLRTTGIPEVTVAARIRRIEREQHGLGFAFYPSLNGVDVVVRAASDLRLKAVRRELEEVLGDAVYAVGDSEVEQVVGRLLVKRRLKLAVAESCTGGLIQDRITAVPGSSRYFLGGVVAYSNEVKVRLLGVKQRTLERHGAVSSQVVKEMALGACRLFGARVGIAVSGVAGPAGGSKEKPVGLVHVGVAFDRRVKSEKHLFAGARRDVKQKAGMACLDFCRRVLERA